MNYSTYEVSQQKEEVLIKEIVTSTVGKQFINEWLFGEWKLKKDKDVVGSENIQKLQRSWNMVTEK